MKNRFINLILVLFVSFLFINNVSAGVLEDKLTFVPSISTIGGKNFDNINSYYIIYNEQAVNLNVSMKFDLKDSSGLNILPSDQTYYYLTLNYCSTGDKTIYDIYSGYDNKIYDVVKTDVSCSASAGTTGKIFIMFVQMKLSYFDDDDSGSFVYRLYFNPVFGLNNKAGYNVFLRFLDSRILSYENFLKVYQEYSAISNQVKIIDKNQEIINKNQEMINKQTETNKKLDEAENTRKGILATIVELPKKIFTLIIDGLKSLFIPDNLDFLNNFVDTLEDKLGFIAEVPVSIIEFCIDLVTTSYDSYTSITFPSISIFGYNFWNTTQLDLTEAINIFKPYKYVTDVICVVICAATLNKWRERFTGGSS